MIQFSATGHQTGQDQTGAARGVEAVKRGQRRQPSRSGIPPAVGQPRVRRIVDRIADSQEHRRGLRGR